MTTNLLAANKQGVCVTNPRPVPAILCLEPWGDEIFLPPETSFLVMFEGPAEQFPSVEWEDSRVTVLGWSGSVVPVHHAGKEVRSSGVVRVPEMPHDKG